MLLLQLVAARPDGAARRVQQQFQLLLPHIGDVLEIARKQAARSADGRIDAIHLRLFLRLTDRSVKRCIDDGSRSAAMNQKQITSHMYLPVS